MSDRKAELEKKRRRLEEIKRAREEKKKVRVRQEPALFRLSDFNLLYVQSWLVK